MTVSSRSLAEQTQGPSDELRKVKAVVGGQVIRLVGRTEAAIDSKQALLDMRLPDEIASALEKPLEELGYSLTSTEVWSIYQRDDVREVSTVRGPESELFLLHIPRGVFEEDSPENFAAFSYLEWMSQFRGKRLRIVSGGLDNYPHFSLKRLTDGWKEHNIETMFVPWSWLSKELGDSPEADDIAQLLGLETGARRGIDRSEPHEPSSSDLERVAQELAVLARADPLGTKRFVETTVAQLGLPDAWNPGDVWSGNATADALALVNFAKSKGFYPSGSLRKEYTVLGVLIGNLYKASGRRDLREQLERILVTNELLPGEEIDQILSS